jgi:Uma2 family endonuclease
MTTATITPPQAHAPVSASGKATGSPIPASPKPYRWQIQAYRDLGATGVFAGLKTMLIHGEILVMTFPKPPHDTALNLAVEALRSAFATGYHVRNQQGLDIGTDNDPGPDLAVVPGSIRDYGTRTPTANLAVLVVEVAESSLFLDTTTKAELYATAGVPDYWVIDVANRRLLVFRDPVALPVGLGATAYRTHRTLAATDSIAPLAAPTAIVRVVDLLP